MWAMPRMRGREGSAASARLAESKKTLNHFMVEFFSLPGAGFPLWI
jgi:hypothetical protein